ncbi:MAG: aspartate-semialdehyde dehydrogenase [Gammaproteobacteria bacterium]|nr:aspartate-semialdehyde dehydrogenase [Gammaproteobacteria bacterium]
MSARATALRIAIVGAGSLIGEALRERIEAGALPCASLTLLEAAGSLGRIAARGDAAPAEGGAEASIGDVDAYDFGEADLVFFCAHAAIATRHAATAAETAWVIDGTHAHRDRPDVELVAADVNPHALDRLGSRGLVALPGSASTALATALAPLHALGGLVRVDVATYHAVSGAGRAGIDGLAADSIALLSGKSPRKRPFGAQIAFNVLPFVGALDEKGVSDEERRLAQETRRLLGAPGLAINVTAVRVPVFFGHGLAVHLQLERSFELAAAIDALRRGPGLRWIEPAQADPGPTPAGSALEPDHVEVGRVRIDESRDRSLNFWVVADNVRKCAAHNAVSVAQILVNNAR